MSNRPPAPQNVLPIGEEDNIAETRNEEILEGGGIEDEDGNGTTQRYAVPTTSAFQAASQAARKKKARVGTSSLYKSMKGKIGIRGSSSGGGDVEETVPSAAATPSSIWRF